MSKTDLDNLKRQIMVLTETSATQKTQAKKLRELSLQKRQSTEQIVRPALTRAGLEIAGLREKLMQNVRTFRDERERLRIPRAETVAARKAAFQESVNLRRAALEKIGHRGTPPIISYMEYLPEPIYIGQSLSPIDPLANFLQDSSINPYDSRAKIYISTNVGFDSGSTAGYVANIGASFDFWYVWSSDSSRGSFLNISAPVTLNGTVDLELVPAELYWLYNILDFSVISFMNVYLEGNGLWFITDKVVQNTRLTTSPFGDDSQFIPVGYQTSNIQYPPFAVPANTTLLIRVGAIFHWEFRNGWGDDDGEPGNLVLCDFANNELDYFVQSPYVAIEVTELTLGPSKS